MDVRLQSFAEALETFAYLANVDIGALAATLDPRLIDGLQNGKAQKFQYTLELCWKAIKVFVKQHEGIDEASPKKVVKAFYLAGYISEDDYLLIEAIPLWEDEWEHPERFSNPALIENIRRDGVRL